jgi:hypothetical protein
MEESRMKKHVTVVGAIQIGFSILWLIAALIVWLALRFARATVGGDDVAITVLSYVGVILPGFIALIATFGLVAGIGLLSYKGWARIITIIVSALGCFNIPIGTLIGVYSIWVLMQDDTVKLFSTPVQQQI